MPPRSSLALTLLLCLPGCGDKSSSGDATGTDGSTTTDSDSDSGGSSTSTTDDSTTDDSAGTSGTSGGSTGAVTDSATTGAETGGPPTEPPPATGIQIVDVTADQGIRVPIAIDGSLVPGNQRNLPLLKGRTTLIRAFWELDPDFEQRDIFATLTLTQADSSTKEFTSFMTAYADPECEGQPQYDCRYKSLINSFNFLVEGEDLQPGTTYSISMVETVPGHENDVSDKIPVFPTNGGTLDIGVEDSYMKMRVMLVPIQHTIANDCPEAPDFDAPWTGTEGDESNAWFFGNRLIAYNPADEVEVQVHSVVNYGGSAEGSSGLLNLMQQLRSQDGADPGWYYYGVIRPCDSGPDFSGVAQLGGPTMWEADQRIAWGVWHSSIGATAGTFVHEIGHEQGRRHIRCSGDEAGVDTSYPDHPEGDTESYGIDVYGPQIDVHPPTDHDYMTYCSSDWVSEWGYDLVLPWIEEISSWEGGDAIPDPEELLYGLVHEDGTSSWWVGMGYWNESRASQSHTVSFGDLGAAKAAWIPYTDSNDHGIIVPVPKGFSAGTTGLAWNDGKASHPIDGSTIVKRLPLARK